MASSSNNNFSVVRQGGSSITPVKFQPSDAYIPWHNNNIPIQEGQKAHDPTGTTFSGATAMKQFAGLSGFQTQITTSGHRVAMWGDLGWHNQLFAGELCFTHRNSQKQVFTALNLRFVNILWNDFYGGAVAMINQAISTQQGLEGFFTFEELTELLRTPTHMWRFNKQYQRAVNSETDVRNIRYLNLNEIQRDWNLYGIFLGLNTGDQSAPYAVSSMLQKGLHRQMVNYWGTKAKNGSTLWLIKKRKKLSNGQWGAPAIHPWCGYDQPTIDDRTYMDVSGAMQIGEVIYVGSVIWWVSATGDIDQYHDLDYDTHTGLTEDPTDMKKTLFGPLTSNIRAVFKSDNLSRNLLI